MTVSVNDRIASALGDGSNRYFTYDFPEDDTDNIIVFRGTEVVDTDDYVVDLATKTVTMDAAPANGVDVFVLSKRDLSQVLSFSRTAQSINFETLVEQLDKIVYHAQELARDTERSVKFSYGDEVVQPTIDPVANGVLGFDGAKKLTLLSTSTISGTALIGEVTTVAALAGLDTSYTSAFVNADNGTSGMFKRVNAVAYAGWISADSTNAIIIQSTDNAAYAWLREGVYNLNLLWFGGVFDALDTMQSKHQSHEKLVWIPVNANATSDILTTASTTGEDHNLTAGDTVKLRLNGGTPGGLTENANYYVSISSTQAVRLHTTRAAALAGTGYIDITSAGAGGYQIAKLGASGNICGDHEERRYYPVGSLVWTGAPQSRVGYRCNTAHYSDTFANDDAAGYWDQGDFTGTDNQEAFQAMVELSEAISLSMHVPRVGTGAIRIANSTTGADDGHITLTGDTFDLLLEGDIYMDDDGITGKGYNLFKTADYNTVTDHNSRKLFRIWGGGSIIGTWSHKPIGNPGSNTRCHVVAAGGYTRFEIHNIWISDTPGTITRIFACNEVSFFNDHVERVGKGGLRATNCYDIRANMIVGRHSSDDIINCHTIDGNIRTRVTVSDCTIYDGEGVTILGAVSSSVRGMTIEFSKGAAIVVGGRAAPEGENAALANVIAGNTILDPLIASADGVSLATALERQAAIEAGSIESSYFAYEYNGTSVNDPLADNVYVNYDPDIADVPQGGSFSIVDNPTKVTRVFETDYFSNLGLGLLFHQDGWFDPEIAATNRVPNGVTLISDVDNVVVRLNVSGFRTGAALFARFLQDTEDERNSSFRNIDVSGVVRDCLSIFSHTFWTNATQAVLATFKFHNINGDLDPAHVSAARNSGTAGTWNTGSADADQPIAFRVNSLRGFSITACELKNCYRPVHGDNNLANGFYKDNVLVCDPVAPALSSSNPGIALPGYSSSKFRIARVNSVPSDGYGTFDHWEQLMQHYREVTLADDAATSFEPPNKNGICKVVSNANSIVAYFAYDVSTGVINAVGTSGGSVTLGTSALAGTTGTDARANYAAVSDGKIYIENRMGNTRTFRVSFEDC